MKSLEVGMYVRTKNGIKQIDEINVYKTKYQWLHRFKYKSEDGTVNLGVLPDKDIIGEPSFDIIDLIEVGDIILFRLNGVPYKYEVEEIPSFDKYLKVVSMNICGQNKFFELKELNILAILTHEQFENNCYKIGD